MTDPTQEELDRFVEQILKHKPKDDSEREEKIEPSSSINHKHEDT